MAKKGQQLGERLVLDPREVPNQKKDENDDEDDKQRMKFLDSIDAMLYAYARRDGTFTVTVTNLAYPVVAAHGINSRVFDIFSTENPRSRWPTTDNSTENPSIKQELDKVQDPAKVDGIEKVKAELAQTKVVLYQTIQSVMERGQTLDELVAKSNDLSWASKSFYTQVSLKAMERSQ